MRKDLRVCIGGSEVVCHPKFFLLLHLGGSGEETLMRQGLRSIRKHFNLVRYHFDASALARQLLGPVMAAGEFPRAEEYEAKQRKIEFLQVNKRLFTIHG